MKTLTLARVGKATNTRAPMQKAADEVQESTAAQPSVIGSVADFDAYLGKVDATTPVLIQFTAPWCRRCTTLKTEISSAFDSSLKWISVDVDDIVPLQERFNVTQLPRLDVYCGGQTSSVEGFDAKLSEVVKMMEKAISTRPVFELSDDF